MEGGRETEKWEREEGRRRGREAQIGRLRGKKANSGVGWKANKKAGREGRDRDVKMKGEGTLEEDREREGRR